MRKLIHASAWVFVTLTPAFAQQVRVQLDLETTRVSFTLGSLLHTVHGSFKLKQTDLWFDASTGKAGGLLVVDAASGETGNGSRDNKMHKVVLESAKYPEFVFVPARVQGLVNPQGESDLKLMGVLTIHGSPHDVSMNVRCRIDGDRLTGVITFPIPYVSWGLKNPSTLFLRVNDSVDVTIQAAGRMVR